jgi:hypothetical protein
MIMNIFKGATSKGETADFKTSRLHQTSRDFSIGDFRFFERLQRLKKTSRDFARLHETS